MKLRAKLLSMGFVVGGTLLVDDFRVFVGMGLLILSYHFWYHEGDSE